MSVEYTHLIEISFTTDAPLEEAADPPRAMVDSSMNCEDGTGANGQAHCSNLLSIDGMVPLYNNPTVKVYDDLPAVSLSINTNQVGRVFQDRSYVFRIRPEQEQNAECDTVWNLNVRGRRGNIVQAYPAVREEKHHCFIKHHDVI